MFYFLASIKGWVGRVPAITPNVRDIRSFSGTKWKKNLGEARAEGWTVYPLLYAPTTERRRAQRGRAKWNGAKKL